MIIIREPQTKDEYQKCCLLIEQAYKEHDYIDYFVNNPTTLFLAESDNKIIGSVGLIVREKNKKSLPTEEIFNFRISDIIGDSNLNNGIFEISRLAALSPIRNRNMMRGLFLAVYLYALNFGIEYAIASVKPMLYQLIKHGIKIPVEKIDAEINKSKVPDCYKGYFLNHPHPFPILVSGKKIEGAMLKIKNEISDTVSFQFSFLKNNDVSKKVLSYEKLG